MATPMMTAQDKAAMRDGFKYVVIKGGVRRAYTTTMAEARAEAGKSGTVVALPAMRYTARNPSSGAKQRARGVRKHGLGAGGGSPDGDWTRLREDVAADARRDIGRSLRGEHMTGYFTPENARAHHRLMLASARAFRPMLPNPSPRVDIFGPKYAEVKAHSRKANGYAREYNELQQAAMREFGTGGVWISGGYAESWPRHIKEELRQLLNAFQREQNLAVAAFKKLHPRMSINQYHGSPLWLRFVASAVKAGGYGFGQDV